MVTLLFEQISTSRAFEQSNLDTRKSGCGRIVAPARVWATCYPLPNFGWPDFAL